jgi:predicted nucleic acid-binding protein
LDASVLVHYALGINGSPEPGDQNGTQGLQALIDSDARLGASPITLAEFSSVMYTKLRDSAGWLASFDEAAVDRADAELMRWIATGQVRIRPLGARAFEMGMAYVSSASRQQRKMKAWDAIHLYEACRWARELDEQVVLATADKDFTRFVDIFPEFGRQVRLLDTTA